MTATQGMSSVVPPTRKYDSFDVPSPIPESAVSLTWTRY